MLELGVLGLGLIFVAVWIMKSESRVNICKAEISRLNNKVSSLEYEKFNAVPAQTPSDTDDATRSLREKNEALKEENKKLKSELTEAKKSLEEVYKALS
ncbi:MAG: hypothetical protein WC738_06865 [Candidatus Omnitrophota bacterium]